MTGEELYDGCRKNSDSAWEYAYNYVLKFLCIKCAQTDRSLLQDLAQETLSYYIKRDLDTIRIPGAYKYLLRTKAFCLYLEHVRKHTRFRYTSVELESKEGEDDYDNPELYKSDKPFEKQLVYREMLSILFGLVETMDTPCDEILRYYFKGKMHGNKVKEIALELNFAPNTFSVKVSRCMDKLCEFTEFKALVKEFT